jgi:hypothetical protein
MEVVMDGRGVQGLVRDRGFVWGGKGQKRKVW